MADEYLQNDLFGDQPQTKKGRRSRFLDKYSKQRFLPYVRIPVEYMVIMVIGILMMMVISYAAGIERGKKNSGAKFVKDKKETMGPAGQKRETEEMLFPGEPDTSALKETMAPDALEAKKAAVLERKEKKDEKSDITVSEETAYIIQLASFRNMESAEMEINKLKKRNVRACLTKSGEWYQVYAAGYQTFDDAKKARQDLIPDYEDCYIKKIK